MRRWTGCWPARTPSKRPWLAPRHLANGTLVLYDVSSAALQGRSCPLGAIGHARDGVNGRLQIGGFWRSSQHVPSRVEALVRVERSEVGSVAGAAPGPACPRVKGAARPCGTGLQPALDPRDPAALGQGVAGTGDGPARLTRPPPHVPGGVPDQRGEPTRRTGGRSPRWVCGSRGVFGAGR